VPFGAEMCGATNVTFSDAAKAFVERGPTASAASTSRHCTWSTQTPPSHNAR